MGIFQLTLIVATLLCSLVAGFRLRVRCGGDAWHRAPGRRGVSPSLPGDGSRHPEQPAGISLGLDGLGDRLAGFGRAWLRTTGWNRASAHHRGGSRVPSWRSGADGHHQRSVEQHSASSRDRRHGRDGAGGGPPRLRMRWNTWNSIRTGLASLVSVLLIILLLRL